LLIGAGAVGGALALRDRSGSVSPRAVPASRSFLNPELLISPSDLASSRAQLLDASRLADFRDSHIPGARHVWWQDTMELNAPYYGMVLKPDDGERDQTRRQQLLQRWQVRTATPVVVYDRGGGSGAARVAWFLRFLGIDAAVLDGGLAGWLALDTSMQEITPLDRSGSVAAVTPLEGFYLSVRQTAGALTDTGAQVIDIRTASEQTGGAMADRTAPGVTWLPRDTLLVDSTGLIAPSDELRPLLIRSNVDLARKLVVIGDTGLDASIPWLVLSLMGALSVAICDGGWQQWTDVSDLPTAPL
jgi:thiosulfate/3-mercaptopyruvate sulfurtransferase